MDKDRKKEEKEGRTCISEESLCSHGADCKICNVRVPNVYETESSVLKSETASLGHKLEDLKSKLCYLKSEANFQTKRISFNSKDLEPLTSDGGITSKLCNETQILKIKAEALRSESNSLRSKSEVLRSKSDAFNYEAEVLISKLNALELELTALKAKLSEDLGSESLIVKLNSIKSECIALRSKSDTLKSVSEILKFESECLKSKADILNTESENYKFKACVFESETSGENLGISPDSQLDLEQKYLKTSRKHSAPYYLIPEICTEKDTKNLSNEGMKFEVSSSKGNSEPKLETNTKHEFALESNITKPETVVLKSKSEALLSESYSIKSQAIALKIASDELRQESEMLKMKYNNLKLKSDALESELDETNENTALKFKINKLRSESLAVLKHSEILLCKSNALKSKSDALLMESVALETESILLKSKFNALMLTDKNNSANEDSSLIVNQDEKEPICQVSNLDVLISTVYALKSESDALTSEANTLKTKSKYLRAKSGALKLESEALEMKLSRMEATPLENRDSFEGISSSEVVSKLKILKSKLNDLKSKSDLLRSEAEALESKSRILETKSLSLKLKAEAIELNLNSLKLNSKSLVLKLAEDSLIEAHIAELINSEIISNVVKFDSQQSPKKVNSNMIQSEPYVFKSAPVLNQIGTESLHSFKLDSELRMTKPYDSKSKILSYKTGTKPKTIIEKFKSQPTSDKFSTEKTDYTSKSNARKSKPKFFSKAKTSEKMKSNEKLTKARKADVNLSQNEFDIFEPAPISNSYTAEVRYISQLNSNSVDQKLDPRISETKSSRKPKSGRENFESAKKVKSKQSKTDSNILEPTQKSSAHVSKSDIHSSEPSNSNKIDHKQKSNNQKLKSRYKNKGAESNILGPGTDKLVSDTNVIKSTSNSYETTSEFRKPILKKSEELEVDQKRKCERCVTADTQIKCTCRDNNCLNVLVRSLKNIGNRNNMSKSPTTDTSKSKIDPKFKKNNPDLKVSVKSEPEMLHTESKTRGSRDDQKRKKKSKDAETSVDKIPSEAKLKSLKLSESNELQTKLNDKPNTFQLRANVPSEKSKLNVELNAIHEECPRCIRRDTQLTCICEDTSCMRNIYCTLDPIPDSKSDAKKLESKASKVKKDHKSKSSEQKLKSSGEITQNEPRDKQNNPKIETEKSKSNISVPIEHKSDAFNTELESTRANLNKSSEQKQTKQDFEESIKKSPVTSKLDSSIPGSKSDADKCKAKGLNRKPSIKSKSSKQVLDAPKEMQAIVIQIESEITESQVDEPESLSQAVSKDAISSQYFKTESDVMIPNISEHPVSKSNAHTSKNSKRKIQKLKSANQKSNSSKETGLNKQSGPTVPNAGIVNRTNDPVLSKNLESKTKCQRCLTGDDQFACICKVKVCENLSAKSSNSKLSELVTMKDELGNLSVESQENLERKDVKLKKSSNSNVKKSPRSTKANDLKPVLNTQETDLDVMQLESDLSKSQPEIVNLNENVCVDQCHFTNFQPLKHDLPDLESYTLEPESNGLASNLFVQGKVKSKLKLGLDSGESVKMCSKMCSNYKSECRALKMDPFKLALKSTNRNSEISLTPMSIDHSSKSDLTRRESEVVKSDVQLDLTTSSESLKLSTAKKRSSLSILKSLKSVSSKSYSVIFKFEDNMQDFDLSSKKSKSSNSLTRTNFETHSVNETTLKQCALRLQNKKPSEVDKLKSDTHVDPKQEDPKYQDQIELNRPYSESNSEVMISKLDFLTSESLILQTKSDIIDLEIENMNLELKSFRSKSNNVDSKLNDIKSDLEVMNIIAKSSVEIESSKNAFMSVSETLKQKSNSVNSETDIFEVASRVDTKSYIIKSVSRSVLKKQSQSMVDSTKRVDAVKFDNVEDLDSSALVATGDKLDKNALKTDLKFSVSEKERQDASHLKYKTLQIKLCALRTESYALKLKSEELRSESKALKDEAVAFKLKLKSIKFEPHNLTGNTLKKFASSSMKSKMQGLKLESETLQLKSNALKLKIENLKAHSNNLRARAAAFKKESASFNCVYPKLTNLEIDKFKRGFVNEETREKINKQLNNTTENDPSICVLLPVKMYRKSCMGKDCANLNVTPKVCSTFQQESNTVIAETDTVNSELLDLESKTDSYILKSEDFESLTELFKTKLEFAQTKCFKSDNMNTSTYEEKICKDSCLAAKTENTNNNLEYFELESDVLKLKSEVLKMQSDALDSKSKFLKSQSKMLESKSQALRSEANALKLKSFESKPKHFNSDDKTLSD